MKHLLLRILVYICFSNFICAQSNIAKRAAREERRWALCHPFIIKKTVVVTRFVVQTTNDKSVISQLDTLVNGGKLDAFRHIFWMACLTKKIGYKKALQLGNAHEKGNYTQFLQGSLEDGNLPDEASCRMDSLNNLIGANIGLLWRKAHVDFDKNEIIKYINNGTCYIIRRNNRGGFIDCNGVEIKQETDFKQWRNKKCVVFLNTLL